MRFTRSNSVYIIKIEKGEEVVDTLSAFCQEEGISNAYFSGIGAAKDVSCGYYALEEKKYYFTEYPELVEVVSLTGNIALKEGKPFIHMHGVFTGRDNRAFGGHIERMTAGIVLEVILHTLQTAIEREYDEETGLALLDCASEF